MIAKFSCRELLRERKISYDKEAEKDFISYCHSRLFVSGFALLACRRLPADGAIFSALSGDWL